MLSTPSTRRRTRYLPTVAFGTVKSTAEGCDGSAGVVIESGQICLSPKSSRTACPSASRGAHVTVSGKLPAAALLGDTVICGASMNGTALLTIGGIPLCTTTSDTRSEERRVGKE